jgi:O-antigen/teichoic acid export membrane protein
LRFWFQSESSIGWRFAGQFLLNQSWAYAILYLLAFVLTVGAIGIFRLCQLAMGPVSVASVGLQSAMISMAAKKFAIDPGRTLRLIFAVASGTAAVTAGWMFLVYLAPVHDVRTVLGPTWPQARSIFLIIGTGVVITAWGGAGAAGLRALRAAKESLWLAAALVPFLLVPALVGAKVHGLHGAAIGALISYTIVTVATWVVLIWTAKKYHGVPRPDDAGDGDGDAGAQAETPDEAPVLGPSFAP